MQVKMTKKLIIMNIKDDIEQRNIGCAVKGTKHLLNIIRCSDHPLRVVARDLLRNLKTAVTAPDPLLIKLAYYDLGYLATTQRAYSACVYVNL